SVCFFFQAEDGIRDLYVTGVQTCALPICLGRVVRYYDVNARGYVDLAPARDRGLRCRANCQRYRECGSDCPTLRPADEPEDQNRSEERRVGKEEKSRWGPHL